MSDFFGQDDDLTYWESMGQTDGTQPQEAAPAEASADTAVTEDVVQEAPTDTVETAAEETQEQQQQRLRDEKGRFAKAQEETPAEAVDPELEAFLAKYGGDAQKALRGAAEQAKLMGRQAQELGEYRAYIEQIQAQQAQAQQPQQQYVAPDALAEWAQSLPPTSLPMVVQQAYQQGNQAAADAALAELGEYDRTAARQLDRWMIQQDFLRTQQQAQQVQTQTQSEWDRAAEQFAQQVPDLTKFAPQMMELAGLPENADILRLIESGSPTARITALRLLYNEARGRETATLNSSAMEIVQQQRDDADAAAAAAQVVSAATTKPMPAGKSAADRIGDEWTAIEQPLKDGWNIG